MRLGLVSTNHKHSHARAVPPRPAPPFEIRPDPVREDHHPAQDSECSEQDASLGAIAGTFRRRPEFIDSGVVVVDNAKGLLSNGHKEYDRCSRVPRGVLLAVEFVSLADALWNYDGCEGVTRHAMSCYLRC